MKRALLAALLPLGMAALQSDIFAGSPAIGVTDRPCRSEAVDALSQPHRVTTRIGILSILKDWRKLNDGQVPAKVVS